MTMNDEQLAFVLAALSDQTNAINRLADAAEVIAHHIAPDQAKRLYAPNYMRPLRDYAAFDWTSIGATVTAIDKHGATEVEHNGHAYKRYRSSDDDPKGVDIRFRRVASGTVDEKNLVWATLIKFADRKREPARPLKGELAEAIQAAQTSQPAQPVQPAQHARPAATAPAPKPDPIPDPIPDALRAEWVAAYDAARKGGTVPVEWGIFAEDTPATLRTKINALNILAAKADPRLPGAGDAPPALPEQSAPVTTLASPSATPDAVLAEPAQKIKARLVGSAERANRASTPRQDGETVRALEGVAGSKALRQRVTQVLFGEPEFAKLDPRKRFAMWDWLRPASSADGKSVSPTNPAAAGEVAELLKMTEAEAEPA